MIVLDNALLRDYLEELTGRRPSEGVVHLLGIRSCRPYDTGNEGEVAISVQAPRPNEYDDVVGCFGAELAVYRGTVDPGASWTKYPPRRAGCAHVADGGPYRQRRGLHRGRPAFVQDGPIRIWRDRDRDGQQDPGEVPRREVGNGIDVHRMGRAGPGVNAWSAGCLGVVAGEWEQFWQLAAAFGPSQIGYELWVFDGPKFGAWFDGRQQP